MEANIISVGNSKGLIIPSPILRKLGLKLKSVVDISLNNDSIVIKPSIRQGWAEAAKIAHQCGDDKLLDADILGDDMEDLEW